MTAQEKEDTRKAEALKAKAMAGCYRLALATKDWHTVIALAGAVSGVCIIMIWDSAGGAIMLCAVEFFKNFSERALDVGKAAEEVAEEVSQEFHSI